MKFDSIIFHVNGGIGKCVASTAIIRAMKKVYDSIPIIVVCGYPDVFKNNPNVEQVYHFNELSHFYENHVFRKNPWVIKKEPYEEFGYYGHKNHLISVWCDSLGFEWDGSPGDIFLSEFEINEGKKFVASKVKPVMLLQTHGGMSSFDGKPIPKGQVRDMPLPLAQAIVDKFKNEYHIIHIKSSNQPKLEGVEDGTYNFRYLAPLVKASDKIICIDSVVEHLSAALGKSATVLWGGTNPSNLGYDIHTNIFKSNVCKTPHCSRPYGWLYDNGFTCPVNEACMNFSLEEVCGGI
jgi:hypothetical protein